MSSSGTKRRILDKKPKRQKGGKPRFPSSKPPVVTKFNGSHETYYPLSSACTVLDKARSTLMRLLPAWEEVTKSKPRRDHGGRWYLSVRSVEALRDDPDLYLNLAGRATKWKQEQDKLKSENKALKSDIKALKRAARKLLERLDYEGQSLPADLEADLARHSVYSPKEKP